MDPTWSIPLTAFLIILSGCCFLDSLFAQSTDFNQPPDESTIQPQVENSSKPESSHINESPFTNETSDSERNYNNPFSTDSSTESDENETYSVKFPSPFWPNTTIIIVKNYRHETVSVEFSPPLAHPFRNDNSRAARKCTEYHNGIQDAKTSIRVYGVGDTILIPTEDELGAHPLVIGGKNATIQAYPHVVALGRLNEDKQFSFQCGGSIIAPKWVLTAAHCTHGITGGVTIARLGIERLNDTNGETIRIKRTIRHPSYRPPAMYHDIALLELSRSVTFNKSGIKPACLHEQCHNISEITFAVCGWGATEFGGGASNTLQEAELTLVKDVDCAMKHSRSIQSPDGLVPSMICAGAPNNNWQQDTCHGDSGGPLLVSHPNYYDFHQIVGVTSFGTGCAFTESPGVYTKVAHYRDWIENIVWPEL